MSALLALALAAATGCPGALASAAATPDGDLAAGAAGLVQALEDAGAGPTAALAAAARALAAAEPGAARSAAADAFRGALSRHCALAGLAAAPAASAADRAALAEVLARPELSPVRVDPTALRRALGRLWDWLVELLGTAEAERYASLGRALFIGVAAAAAALAVAALRRRGRGGRADAPGGFDGRERASDARPEPGAADAEDALRRGDATEAVRLALLAALGALERAGRIPRGRTLTNEEVVRAVTSSTTASTTSISTPTSTSTASTTPTPTPTASTTPTPTALASDLALLARAFDRAVYGGLDLTADEARGAVERGRRVIAATGGPA